MGRGRSGDPISSHKKTLKRNGPLRRGVDESIMFRSGVNRFKPDNVLSSKDIVDEMRRMNLQELANILLSKRNEAH